MEVIGWAVAEVFDELVLCAFKAPLVSDNSDNEDEAKYSHNKE